MITKEYLKELVAKRLNEATKPHSCYGSVPKALFKEDGTFNTENWNGGDAIIRKLVYALEDDFDNSYCKDFDLTLNNREFSGELIISFNRYNDSSYIQIAVNWYEYLNSETTTATTTDLYYIEYYKDRGKTDKIVKNGKLINLDEYVTLLQIIEASGYSFK